MTHPTICCQMPNPSEPPSEVTRYRLQHLAEWRLVYVGLTLVQYGLVVTFAAGLAGLVIEILIADATLQHIFRFLTLSVGGASLIISFIGFCLCWNPPAYSGLRRVSRSLLVDIILTGIGLVGCLVFVKTTDRYLLSQDSFALFFRVGFIGFYFGMVLWSLFLQGIAEEFERDELSELTRISTKFILIVLVFLTPIFLMEGATRTAPLTILFNTAILLFYFGILHRLRRAMSDGLKIANRATVGEPRA